MKSANNPRRGAMHTLRRWCMALHRDLGYLFGGVVIIYAVSGIAMNHRDTFNPYYSAEVTEFTIPADMAIGPEGTGREQVGAVIARAGDPAAYSKHYVSRGHLKILLRGGSSIDVDLATRRAVCERLSERVVLGSMARLHYNPGSWWTVFSDIFACALLLVTLTGFLILRGPKGFLPRGALLLASGLLIPVLFLLL